MKIFKYLGIAALMSLSMSSCSDFLDPDNKSTNNDDADAYLTAHPEALKPVAFNAFRYFATHIELHEEATDLYFVNMASDGYGDFTITPEDGTVKTYYTNAYKAINYANGMVWYGGETSDLGYQGRFLRNLGYYYLIQQFGSVPYVTEYIQSSSRDYPRTDLKEMYEGMIADLTDIYNNSKLPATDHNGEVSKQAVAALLAKVELSAAWDLDVAAKDLVAGTYTVNSTAHFTQAAAWAEKAINGVQLTMPFAQKWAPDNEGNVEEIFSMQWERAGVPGDEATSGHSLQNQYMNYYGNCTVIGQKGTPSGGKHRMSYKSLRLFGYGDERFEGTFMTEYWNAPLNSANNAEWGTEGYFAYYNCTREQLAKKNLAVRFYPSWMSEADVRADLQANYPNNTKSFAKGYGILADNAQAVILNYPIVTTIPFNADGTLGAAVTTPTTTFLNQSAYNGVCVKKYDDPASAQVTRDNDYRDVPLFHVSDMYLIAAEAYYMAGQEAQALAKVNAVRTRAKAEVLASFSAYECDYAGVANNVWTPTVLDVILDERARECYAERTRYEDLRRTKQLVRYNLAFSRTIKEPNQMKGPDGEYKLLRPIPQIEINTNTGMTDADQNPGY